MRYFSKIKLLFFSKFLEKALIERLGMKVGVSLTEFAVQDCGEKVELNVRATGTVSKETYELLSKYLGI